jgi:hypothetical protein
VYLHFIGWEMTIFHAPYGVRSFVPHELQSCFCFFFHSADWGICLTAVNKYGMDAYLVQSHWQQFVMCNCCADLKSQVTSQLTWVCYLIMPNSSWRKYEVSFVWIRLIRGRFSHGWHPNIFCSCTAMKQQVSLNSEHACDKFLPAKSGWWNNCLMVIRWLTICKWIWEL